MSSRIEKLCSDRMPESAVSERSNANGKKLKYADQHYIITRANQIFGCTGWTYSIEKLERIEAVQEEKGGKTRWKAGYEAIVLVSAHVENFSWVNKTDVGYGSGYGPSLTDACESAGKEAVTDALKRSLRTFGPSLGLAVYETSLADVGSPRFAPDGTPIELAVDRAHALIRQAPDKFTLWTVAEETVRGLVAALGEDPRGKELKKAFAERRKALEAAATPALPEPTALALDAE